MARWMAFGERNWPDVKLTGEYKNQIFHLIEPYRATGLEIVHYTITFSFALRILNVWEKVTPRQLIYGIKRWSEIDSWLDFKIQSTFNYRKNNNILDRHWKTFFEKLLIDSAFTMKLEITHTVWHSSVHSFGFLYEVSRIS